MGMLRTVLTLGMIPLGAWFAYRLPAPTGSRWFGLEWPNGGDPDVALLLRARAAGCTHLVLSPPQPGQSWAPLGGVGFRSWHCFRASLQPNCRRDREFPCS